MSNDDSDDGIHRVETVPPPEGEGDAYNAPTRVGPMAAAVVNEMMHAAERKAAELSKQAKQKTAAHASTAREASPASNPEAARPRVPPAQASPPSSAPRLGATGYSVAPVDVVQDGATANASSLPRVAAPPVSTAKMVAPPIPVRAAAFSPTTSYAQASNPQPSPPRMYDDEDEGNAATVLSDAAQAPVISPLARVARPPPAAPLPPRAFPPMSVADAPILGPPSFAFPTNSASAAPQSPFGPPPSASAAPAALPPSAFDSPHATWAAPLRSRKVALWLPALVGFAIFFVGLALYLWVR